MKGYENYLSINQLQRQHGWLSEQKDPYMQALLPFNKALMKSYNLLRVSRCMRRLTHVRITKAAAPCTCVVYMKWKQAHELWLGLGSVWILSISILLIDFVSIPMWFKTYLFCLIIATHSVAPEHQKFSRPHKNLSRLRAAWFCLFVFQWRLWSSQDSEENHMSFMNDWFNDSFKMYLFHYRMNQHLWTNLLNAVLPTHFQGKLLKEGWFVVKWHSDVIA